ncbi:MAG: HAMP domain-containing histidine kinase [Ignavibacterium sp.]|nr:HAMP domain-containing histidine kinase [Ignavibacterium sp.]
MRLRHSFVYNLIIFVFAQLVWLAVLLLWIYWYVTNNIIFEQVGEELSPQIVVDAPSVAPFVVGIVMLTGLSFILVLFFRHLSIQIRLTKLYDNFIANITHELKSPLSSIQLYLETLRTREVPPDKSKEFYDLMIRDSARLQNLINSILEISALEGKQNRNHFTTQRVNEIFPKLIRDSVEQFRLPDNSLDVKVSGDCEVFIDVNSFKMVFDNLVDNAVKYSPGNLKIEVFANCNPKKLIVDFKDNAIGIAGKEQKKIFQKFYRIYDKDIPNVKGTGLGLYWAREIIKTHKGKISVHSDGRGKGTTFRIELPVVKKKKTPPKKEKER